MTEHDERPLRAITYLAPGIPLGFFEAVTRTLERALGRPVTLESDERVSGPMHGDHDPFAAGRVDLGFLCSPSFLYLRSRPVPSVELVGAGFVFRDPRNGGRAEYFSDVIVRADRGVSCFEDLRGSSFGFNDTCSLSGYFAARQELAHHSKGPEGQGFFRSESCTGSHEESIRAVLSGRVDVAAIDSNVLALVAEGAPELRSQVRVVESWGPHPIQPVVISSALATELGAPTTEALLAIADDAEASAALARYRLQGCVPIGEDHYAEERAVLEELGHLEPRRC